MFLGGVVSARVGGGAKVPFNAAFCFFSSLVLHKPVLYCIIERPVFCLNQSWLTRLGENEKMSDVKGLHGCIDVNDVELTTALFTRKQQYPVQS